MKEKILLLIGIVAIVGLVAMFIATSKEINSITPSFPTELSSLPPPPSPPPSPPLPPDYPMPDNPKLDSLCRPTGCSGQVCSDKDIMTTCLFREEYICYRNARCERQADGECGWTETPELKQCLALY